MEKEREREVIWYFGEEMDIDYTITYEENRKRREEKEQEYLEKHPNARIYVY